MSSFLLGGELAVNRLGYGAMRLTGQPGNFGPYHDPEQGRVLLRRAVELGVNFIDTADAYGPGDNELLIAEALRPYPSGVVIGTKGGVVKTGPEARWPDGTPGHLRAACEASLRRLGVERIDLYQLHRPDPKVPFEESIGALAALREEGKVRLLGLSNVTLPQLEAARAITAIASVQNSCSLADRSSDAVLEACAAHGIAFIPYGPLGADAMRPGAPLAEARGVLGDVAGRLGATASQVALAWLLRRAPNVIVIPGTTSLAHLEENVAAASLALSDEDFAMLSRG
ncbi:MAG: pyridoxine 4-dehydrogenase [Chthoniobacter sp.]|jgi:aryl-alcohol dehydrogenase-like predicted oxidoreductase|nr:pyridoxine 4-dehydrogenase [Chthoniobacter sp.]